MDLSVLTSKDDLFLIYLILKTNHLTIDINIIINATNTYYPTNYIYLIKTRLFATSKLLMLSLLSAIVNCLGNN